MSWWDWEEWVQFIVQILVVLAAIYLIVLFSVIVISSHKMEKERHKRRLDYIEEDKKNR